MTGESGEAVAGGGRLKPALRLAGFIFVALVSSPSSSTCWSGTGRRPPQALRHATLWWLVPAAACAVGGMFVLAWRWGAAIIAVGGEPAGLHRVSVPSSSEKRASTYRAPSGRCWDAASWPAARAMSDRLPTPAWRSPSSAAIWRRRSLPSFWPSCRLIGGSINMPWWPVAVVAAVGITAIHPAVSRRILALVGRVLGRQADRRDPELDSLPASDRHVHTGVDPDRRRHDAGDEVAGRPPADRPSGARRGRELDHRVHHSVTGRDRGS